MDSYGIATLDFATFFFKLTNTVKLFHWQTSSYAAHQASDKLHTNLQALVDKFMEVAQGKAHRRIPHHVGGRKEEVELKIKVPSMIANGGIAEFDHFLSQAIEFLMSDWKPYGISTKSSELLNIRDEIVAEIEQTQYLLSFQ